MPLPASGPLTLTQIQAEFGGTAPVGLSEYYRGGPYVPASINTATVPSSGPLAVSNFYGTAKRVTIPLTISSPAYNYDVYTNRGPNYVAGVSDIQVTVGPSAVVGSTSTAAYAMLVPSTFDAGDTISIVNNGVIQGMGGTGGPSILGASNGPAGGTAGNALYVNRPVSITNNSVIAGGGGGGGTGGGGQDDKGPARWGGAGGGGAGYNGGVGGAANGWYAGSDGTSSAGGAGAYGDAAPGGAGGGRGAVGVAGTNSGGANPRLGGAGGAAGYYIVGNPFVTWAATGTRQGNVG